MSSSEQEESYITTLKGYRNQLTSLLELLNGIDENDDSTNTFIMLELHNILMSCELGINEEDRSKFITKDTNKTIKMTIVTKIDSISTILQKYPHRVKSDILVLREQPEGNGLIINRLSTNIHYISRHECIGVISEFHGSKCLVYIVNNGPNRITLPHMLKMIHPWQIYHCLRRGRILIWKGSERKNNFTSDIQPKEHSFVEPQHPSHAELRLGPGNKFIYNSYDDTNLDSDDEPNFGTKIELEDAESYHYHQGRTIQDYAQNSLTQLLYVKKTDEGVRKGENGTLFSIAMFHYFDGTFPSDLEFINLNSFLYTGR